jgi:hypothetical protein
VPQIDIEHVRANLDPLCDRRDSRQQRDRGVLCHQVVLENNGAESDRFSQPGGLLDLLQAYDT